MKATKILFNIMSVICFIYGAFYVFTLVFIPVGVYCFIAARRFSYKAEHMYDTYTVNNDILKNYTIFVSIACFPLGLLAIIPYYLLVSNKVKISGFTVSEKTDIDEKELNNEPEISKEEVVVETNTETQANEVETEEEKKAKFEKLKNFKEKGIITDEELEMAREQLFGKSNK